MVVCETREALRRSTGYEGWRKEHHLHYERTDGDGNDADNDGGG